MMKVARLLTLRSLRSRPLRMLLSMFGIVLGVATILGIGVTNRSAMSSVEQVFKDTSGKANLVVSSADVDSRGFTDKILARLDAVPGIAAAVPSVSVTTILADEQASMADFTMGFFGFSGGGLTIYGIDPGRDRQARNYTLVEGSFLSEGLEGEEVVLVKSFAEDNDLKVGEVVQISTEAGIERLRIIGLMAKEGPGQLNNGAFGIVPLGTIQKLFFREGKLNQIDLVATPEYQDAEKLDSLRENLQTLLGQDYSVVFPASQGQRMTQMLGSYQIGLNFLSGMALFVGAFLIFNAFLMTVVERTREFGMLRTVGMSSGQVTTQVLAEAAVLGVVGSLLGLGLGVLMSQGLSQVMAFVLAMEMAKIDISTDLVITSTVVGVVVSILAAALPAFQAGKVSPLEALRVRAKSREGWLIRYGWIPGGLLLVICAVILVLNPFPYDVQFRLGSMVVVGLFFGGTLLIPSSVSLWERVFRPAMRALYGGSGRLGSSNVQRSKFRTTLTVAALMIGVSMIIVVWAMTESFKSDLDDWLEGYIGGDLFVTSSLPMGRDVWKKLESVPGVQAVTPVGYFEVDWLNPAGVEERIAFMAFDPASYSQVTRFTFNDALTDASQALQKLAGGDAIFISSVIAEKFGLKQGDQVSLVTRSGKRPFEIAAVVVDYYNQGLVVSGSWGDMRRYFREGEANVFLIKIEPGLSRTTMRDRIDGLYGARENLIIETNQDLLGRVSVLMEQSFRMFDVLAVIAMLVGFFGIVNTLTMNVMERTQEIGMLRGVGMTQGQVVRMILAEAALIGIIGGVLGLIFGVILSRIFMAAMTAMSGYTLVYILPAARVFLAVLIAFLVSQIAATLPAARAARIRILDAIHYE